jgi:hypothetical protein
MAWNLSEGNKENMKSSVTTAVDDLTHNKTRHFLTQALLPYI